MKKLLVIGGTHGNERLGIDLVASLITQPMAGIDAIIANPRAVASGTRFVESDLNRSFGTELATYEGRRAKELERICSEYELVLDFHNTESPSNNTCFVGESPSVDLYDVIREFGFSSCIQATYDCINKFCDNVISIEISVDDPLDTVSVWRELLSQRLEESSKIGGAGQLTIYQFEKRVTWEQKGRFCFKGWKPFVPLSEADKRQLGCTFEVAPIFIGSTLTEFYATLLRKVGYYE